VALIVDAGPLYASLNRSDPDHARCRSLLDTFSELLVVPAPVLVEVEYLARTRMHVGISVAFLGDVIRGVFEVEELGMPDYRRIREVCEQYSESAIGLVDAAVLAVAERLNESKVATLDHRHFRMLRPRHVDALQLLPE
jgi:predicted nucleic acid-binding protein